MNIAAIFIETFFGYQKLILFPVIQRVGREEQQLQIASRQSEKRALVLGGDGRADSPVQNSHSHESELFPKCAHGPINNGDIKKWFQPCKNRSIL